MQAHTHALVHCAHRADGTLRGMQMPEDLHHSSGTASGACQRAPIASPDRVWPWAACQPPRTHTHESGMLMAEARRKGGRAGTLANGPRGMFDRCKCHPANSCDHDTLCSSGLTADDKPLEQGTNNMAPCQPPPLRKHRPGPGYFPKNTPPSPCARDMTVRRGCHA